MINVVIIFLQPIYEVFELVLIAYETPLYWVRTSGT